MPSNVFEVVELDGRVLHEGEAAAAVLRRLPGLKAMARLPLDRPYRLVARNRHRLSRVVPDVPPTVRRPPE